MVVFASIGSFTTQGNAVHVSSFKYLLAEANMKPCIRRFWKRASRQTAQTRESEDRMQPVICTDYGAIAI